MSSDLSVLLELEHKALALKNAADWSAAARLYERILDIQPDWEHGYGFFDLAECYEQLGYLGQARSAYEGAANMSPSDSVLLGGLASFLFLHGDTSEAFERHCALLKIETQHGNSDAAARTLIALRALGLRLGLSNDAIESRILKCTAGGFGHDDERPA